MVLLLGLAGLTTRGASRREAEGREAERQRRLASLGEMSSVMAHELRNPLASLKGHAQLLLESLGERATGPPPSASSTRRSGSSA